MGLGRLDTAEERASEPECGSAEATYTEEQRREDGQTRVGCSGTEDSHRRDGTCTMGYQKGKKEEEK